MFHTFGRYKRSLLTVLGVLLASTLATASAATINMSQLTSNTAQPVVINSMPSNVDTTTPTLQADNNGQPILKVANTPVSTPIVGTPEKATINTSNSNYDGHLDNFPSRKVTIVVPAKLRNENTAQLGRYMTDRLSNTLKYPYYDTAIVLIRQQLKLELLTLHKLQLHKILKSLLCLYHYKTYMYKSTVLIAHMHIIMMIVKCTSPQR